MLWEQGDIDEKVILGLFLTCGMTRDGGMWNLKYTAIPLGRPWSDLSENAWNHYVTHLRLPGQGCLKQGVR